MACGSPDGKKGMNLMIIARNHSGRTATGKYAYRPLVQPGPDDFHPESVYWRMQMNGVLAELQETIPDEQMDMWFEETFPEGASCTCKDIALKARELLHELSIAKERAKS
jgi:hypothetical protein